MKKILLLFFIFCFVLSCNTYDLPECGYNDVNENLSWLKEIIDDRNANPTEMMRYCYITQAKLEKRTVFILGDCNPAINKITFVYNCEGNPIQDDDGRNIGVSEVTLTNQKLIWQPEDFACDLNGNTLN